MNVTPCTKHVWSPALWFHGNLLQHMADTCWGFILTCQHQEAPMAPLGDPPEMGKVCGLNRPFWSNFSVSLTISELLRIRSTNLICRIINCQRTCDLCYYCVQWLHPKLGLVVRKHLPLLGMGGLEARLSSSLASRASLRLEITHIGTTRVTPLLWKHWLLVDQRRLLDWCGDV